MAVYFASDLHLRIDRPDRSNRVARWVDGLEANDELYLVGDVCDFWFASRERRLDPMRCRGLESLANFRNRGGRLNILPGNHDHWLGLFFEEVLRAQFVHEPLTVEIHGLRVHLVHGHKTGGRPPWKGVMESYAFLKAFEHLPSPIADRLDKTLETKNDETRDRDERRLMPRYRTYLKQVGGRADIVVFGHIHTPMDDRESHPRLIILGGWHSRTSYLKVDAQGARLVVSHDSDTVGN